MKYNRKHLIGIPVESRNIPQMEGKRNHMLTVIGFDHAHRTTGGTVRHMWQCRCDCGVFLLVSTTKLRRGQKSCGCIRVTHGAVGTPEYTSWSAMKERCAAKRGANWRNYGLRGIRVCDRWLNFSFFLEDLGPRPSLDHSLERIDNNGNYEPGNVKWGTALEQGNNRRGLRLITFQGETKTIKQWALSVGLNYMTVFARIVDRGWSVDAALTTPAALKHLRRSARLTL